MKFDLEFDTVDERECQYNARNSVASFEHEMALYASLAARSKATCAGILDVQYGPGKAERLDIFPVAAQQQPAPLFVFIHGGYWHAQTKEDAGSMVQAFVEHGVAVALVEYTLLPEATLAEVVREMRSAIAWLHANCKSYGIDRDRIYVGGSSAGGHLAGMLMTDDWQDKYGLPSDIVKGALCLSGLYDIRPLCDISINEWLRLTREQAGRLSPALLTPRAGAHLLFCVGGLETLGFKHQTYMMFDAWSRHPVHAKLIEDAEHNHFNLVNTLADPNSTLFNEMMSLVNKS